MLCGMLSKAFLPTTITVVSFHVFTAVALAAPTTCQVRKTPLSPAETAMYQHKYKDAEELLKSSYLSAGTEKDRLHNELVRTMLLEGKLTDAEEEAKAWSDQDPQSAWAKLARNEVQWRKGEISEAAPSIMKLVNEAPCIARVHAHFAEAMKLSGRYASARKQFDIAHKLDPLDEDIESERLRLMTRTEKATELQHYVDHSTTLSDSDREEIRASIKKLQEPVKEACRMVKPVTGTVTIPFQMIMANNAQVAGLSIAFNDKVRRLEIDTGAHGLTLTGPAAKALHLPVEEKIRIYGIGDSGSNDSYVSHVKKIRIGSLEFEDCEVSVLKGEASMGEQDGLVGADVFANFLVTLDFPGHALKLDALPPLPSSTASTAQVSLETSDNSDRPIADRYTDPSMADWTQVFRAEHNLLMPTRLNGGPIRLFILDTGSASDIISTRIGRDYGPVKEQPNVYIQGLNGRQKAYYTGPITIDFAGMRLASPHMLSINTERMSYLSGIAISGFIGVPSLHQTTMKIDYRDNLVKFIYDIKRLQKCVPDMYGRYLQADCIKQ